MGSTEPPLQGYVDKLGKYLSFKWKRRWVCIEGENICYYTNEDKKDLKGLIPIKDIMEIRLADKHEYSHHLSHQEKRNSMNQSNNKLNLSGSTSSTSSNIGNSNGSIKLHQSVNLSNNNNNNNNNSNNSVNSSNDSVNNSSVNSSSINISKSFSGGYMLNHQNSIDNLKLMNTLNNSSGNLANLPNNNNSNNSFTTIISQSTNNINLTNNKDNSNNSNNINNINNINSINSINNSNNINSINSNNCNSSNNSNNNSSGSNLGVHFWIFTIKIPQRIYEFKASSEHEMHYWVQGLKNILVDRELNSNKQIENKRYSQRLQFNEVLMSEIVRIQKLSTNIKKSHKDLKEDIRKQLLEFSTWSKSFEDNIVSYLTRVRYNDSQLRKTIEFLHSEINYLKKSNEKQNNPQLNSASNNNNNNNNNNSNNNNNNNGENGAEIHHHNRHLSTTQLPAYKPSYVQQSLVSPNGMALWFPDQSSSNCSMCQVLFTFFKRRHHCRNCGFLFCGNCSKKKREVKGYTEKVRVCENCSVSIGLAFTNQNSKVQNTLSMS